MVPALQLLASKPLLSTHGTHYVRMLHREALAFGYGVSTLYAKVAVDLIEGFRCRLVRLVPDSDEFYHHRIRCIQCMVTN